MKGGWSSCAPSVTAVCRRRVRPRKSFGPGGGAGVISRAAIVRTSTGVDVTDAFRRGAEIALDAVKQHRIQIAVLKDGSPSCGRSFVYDGTFSGTRNDGPGGLGVTSALLESHGVRVFDERSIDDASAFLVQLERSV